MSGIHSSHIVHIVGFRSSERMVLHSFLSVLERKHSVSFSVLSQVNDGVGVDVAVVNMAAITTHPEVNTALMHYVESVPCVLLYDEKQPLVDAYSHGRNLVLRRPINFSQLAENIFQCSQQKAPEKTEQLHINSGATVLVVDDSPSVRTDMRHKLSEYGVTVETANDADQALSLVDTKDYALIFMDVLMPGDKDGYDACRQIKTQTPDLPVVLLTSRDSIASKVRGRVAKCDQYIIKPANKAKVEEVLRTYLFHGSDDLDLALLSHA